MTARKVEEAAVSSEDQAAECVTDWDAYYASPYPTAVLSRKITGHRIIAAIKRHVVRNPVIVELGGADSCFLELIREQIQPREYHLVDLNQAGLQRVRQRPGTSDNVFLYCRDILSLDLPLEADLVLSVGLIEHFGPSETRRAVQAHFQPLKEGGIALMTFPTPTWLYRLTRSLSELCGAWIFHDERPLGLQEVEQAAEGRGRVLEKHLVWPVFLTQYHVLWEKTGLRSASAIPSEEEETSSARKSE